MTLDLAVFRDALAQFASGVTVCTTRDEAGRQWGFTASAFSSLSLDPPLVLVCLDTRADCADAFSQCSTFAINILSPADEAIASRFATKGIDKFAESGFEMSDLGNPRLEGALAVIECAKEAVLPGGDHSIIVGRALSARVGSGEPTVYFQRRFHRIAPPR